MEKKPKEYLMNMATKEDIKCYFCKIGEIHEEDDYFPFCTVEHKTAWGDANWKTKTTTRFEDFLKTKKIV